jgi:hypothetical protein
VPRLFGLAEAQGELGVEEWIGRARRHAGGELVGVGAQALGEASQQLERRDALALFEPGDVRGGADVLRERALAQTGALTGLAKPGREGRGGVDVVGLLARHCRTIGNGRAAG